MARLAVSRDVDGGVGMEIGVSVNVVAFETPDSEGTTAS